MSSKRILVVMMAILVALTATLALAQDAKKSEAAPAKDAEKAPRLTVVEPVKDYGTVPKGEKLMWTFAVKNTGTGDLQIIAARPACGCTVAEFDKVVKPGETGLYTGQCYQFCGLRHADMRWILDVRSESDYQQWLTQTRQAQGVSDGDSGLALAGGSD